MQSARAARGGLFVRWARTAVAILTFATAYWFSLNPAEAVAPSAAGWWWVAGGQGLPTTTPPGGLWVSQGPQGQVAVSALYLGAHGLVGATLTLEVDQAIGTPSLRACPAAQPWIPESGGPLANAPEPACATSASGILKSPTTVTFDLTPLGTQQGLDIVLLPDPNRPAPFSVTFRPPTASTLAVKTQPMPTVQPSSAPPASSADPQDPLPHGSVLAGPPLSARLTSDQPGSAIAPTPPASPVLDAAPAPAALVAARADGRSPLALALVIVVAATLCLLQGRVALAGARPSIGTNTE